MSLTRIGAAVVGGCITMYRMWEQAHLGFPDRHLTTLDRPLYAPLLALAGLLALASAALLWRGRWALLAAVVALPALDLALTRLGAALGLEDCGWGGERGPLAV